MLSDRRLLNPLRVRQIIFHLASTEEETQKTDHEEEEEEEEEEDRAWAVLSSSFTAEDPPLFSFWSFF